MQTEENTSSDSEYAVKDSQYLDDKIGWFVGPGRNQFTFRFSDVFLLVTVYGNSLELTLPADTGALRAFLIGRHRCPLLPPLIVKNMGRIAKCAKKILFSRMQSAAQAKIDRINKNVADAIADRPQ